MISMGVYEEACPLTSPDKDALTSFTTPWMGEARAGVEAQTSLAKAFLVAYEADHATALSVRTAVVKVMTAPAAELATSIGFYDASTVQDLKAKVASLADCVQGLPTALWCSRMGLVSCGLSGWPFRQLPLFAQAMTGEWVIVVVDHTRLDAWGDLATKTNSGETKLLSDCLCWFLRPGDAFSVRQV